MHVEKLDLLVELSLGTVEFDLFFLELLNLSLQLFHSGALNCSLQFPFLRQNKQNAVVRTQNTKTQCAFKPEVSGTPEKSKF